MAHTMTSVRPSLVVASGSARAELEVAPADEGPAPEHYTATVATRDLRATVRFYELRLRLAAYFAGLAENWRGWHGPKQWASAEEDLCLTATHDGAGHITLAATLKRQSDSGRPEWEVRADILLEVAALEDVARAARRFEQATSP
jgi:hypothetical protein